LTLVEQWQQYLKIFCHFCFFCILGGNTYCTVDLLAIYDKKCSVCMNKAKYLPFFGIFHYFLIFFENYSYFFIFNCFGHSWVTNGWKYQIKKYQKMFTPKLPILGGFSHFLWKKSGYFINLYSFSRIHIFSCFNTTLSHRSVFSSLLCVFYIFRWLRLYIEWK
jgi:hypothetical protein